jgi:D-3-phosphoglycerate dehydrogenase
MNGILMKNSVVKKVLIAAPVHKVLIEGLESMGYECMQNEKITQGAAPGLIAGCTGIITSTRLQLDKALLDAAPLLKWIGRMGSGMEVIDLQYAASKGIKTFGSPEGNCNAVGEHALGLLLSLIRRIVVSNNEMKGGVWLRDENRGIELEGKTIGIIGFGHTGRSFAKKLSGFDMQIFAYDKYNTAAMAPGVVNCESLGPIFEQADIVSFHVPLQPDTIHYFNEDFARAMNKPFIIINTSRGGVVDTRALYNGIKSGKVIGACLDVYEYEPVSNMPPLLLDMANELITLPNVITTPHIAGYTHEALFKMSKTLLENIYVI